MVEVQPTQQTREFVTLILYSRTGTCFGDGESEADMAQASVKGRRHSVTVCKAGDTKSG